MRLHEAAFALANSDWKVFRIYRHDVRVCRIAVRRNGGGELLAVGVVPQHPSARIVLIILECAVALKHDILLGRGFPR